MHRHTVMRVAPDFWWPAHVLWDGYIVPDEYLFPQCPDCIDKLGGFSCTGLNKASRQVLLDFDALHIDDEQEHERVRWNDKITQDEVAALLREGCLRNFTHEWKPENGWVEKSPPYVPSAQQVNDWQGRGKWGHSDISRWILVEARCKRLGIWGFCPTCSGHGDIATDDLRAQANMWEPIEPPSGTSWQLWECESSGSPVSPVFPRAFELAVWCSGQLALVNNQMRDWQEWWRFFKWDESIKMNA